MGTEVSLQGVLERTISCWRGKAYVVTLKYSPKVDMAGC